MLSALGVVLAGAGTAFADAWSNLTPAQQQGLIDGEYDLMGDPRFTWPYQDGQVFGYADAFAEAESGQGAIANMWGQVVNDLFNTGAATPTDALVAEMGVPLRAGFTSVPAAEVAGASDSQLLSDLLPEEMASPEIAAGSVVVSGVIQLAGALDDLLLGPPVTYGPGTLEQVVLCSNNPVTAALSSITPPCENTNWPASGAVAAAECTDDPEHTSGQVGWGAGDESWVVSKAANGSLTVNAPGWGGPVDHGSAPCLTVGTLDIGQDATGVVPDAYLAMEDLNGTYVGVGTTAEECTQPQLQQYEPLGAPYMTVTHIYNDGDVGEPERCEDSLGSYHPLPLVTSIELPSDFKPAGLPTSGPAPTGVPVTTIPATTGPPPAASAVASALQGAVDDPGGVGQLMAGMVTVESSAPPEPVPVTVPECDYGLYPEQASACVAQLQAAGFAAVVLPVTDPTCASSSYCSAAGTDPAGTVEGLSSTDTGSYTEAGDGEQWLPGTTLYVFEVPEPGTTTTTNPTTTTTTPTTTTGPTVTGDLLEIPPPFPNELSTHYQTRLETIGFTNVTIQDVSSVNEIATQDPNTALGVTMPDGSLAGSGTETQADTPLKIDSNPEGSPALGTIPTVPASSCGLTPPSASVDFGPITGLNFGSVFPFSVIPWLQGIVGSVPAGQRPDVSFNVFGTQIDTSSYYGSVSDAVFGVIRSVIEVLLWLSVGWVLYRRIIGAF